MRGELGGQDLESISSQQGSPLTHDQIGGSADQMFSLFDTLLVASDLPKISASNLSRQIKEDWSHVVPSGRASFVPFASAGPSWLPQNPASNVDVAAAKRVNQRQDLFDAGYRNGVLKALPLLGWDIVRLAGGALSFAARQTGGRALDAITANNQALTTKNKEAMAVFDNIQGVGRVLTSAVISPGQTANDVKAAFSSVVKHARALYDEGKYKEAGEYIGSISANAALAGEGAPSVARGVVRGIGSLPDIAESIPRIPGKIRAAAANTIGGSEKIFTSESVAASDYIRGQIKLYGADPVRVSAQIENIQKLAKAFAGYRKFYPALSDKQFVSVAVQLATDGLTPESTVARALPSKYIVNGKITPTPNSHAIYYNFLKGENVIENADTLYTTRESIGASGYAQPGRSIVQIKVKDLLKFGLVPFVDEGAAVHTARVWLSSDPARKASSFQIPVEVLKATP